ncbi:MAG: hypothetical protein H7Y01_03580 [Ferruginibacter sp.]|nr:hypothetical protein [Chitinophagaceae bacterium]
MQHLTKTRFFLIAAISLLIIACKDASKEEKTPKDTPPGTTMVDATTPPPAGNPPGVEMKNVRKCFANDGLQYNTIITLNYASASEVTGSFVSEELESNKKEAVKFTGTIDGNQLTVQFRGAQPVVGAASEWTTKPWTIETGTGKEKLTIVFNAKNSETNTWKETGYEFEMVDCK